MMVINNPAISIVTLGGGCFWCLEGVYEKMRGVVGVVSGYMGGMGANPTYQAVCTGQTGHAEVVQISYDTTHIGLADILQVFFTIHDPTTLNRQGNDIGTQYRSVIFYHNAAQQALAVQVMAQVQSQHTQPVVTELTPVTDFYRAEDMHQHYFALHPQQGYCQFVVAPKVAKFEHYFPSWVQPRG